MSIQISAVICTFNRAHYLRKAIQSLVDQTLNTDIYEILVIDNGSTDETKQVVTKEFAHVTNLYYLYEPVLGLNQARNTGWQNAKGKYVAYLDDDAIAYPNWLEKILKVFETVTPQPGVVGGKVEPIWEAAKPHWLPDRLLPYLTIIDWSAIPVILDDWRYIAGTNMVFPKLLLETVGGFQVNLDRKGRKLLSNGDILLENQLKARGYTIYYDPEIAVKHHITASRLTQSWFTQRVYFQGISDAYLILYQDSTSIMKRIKLGFEKARKLLKSPRNLAYLLIPTNDSNRFSVKCYILKEIGHIVGLFTTRE